MTVILAQCVKVSMFRNAVQLSVGFETLVDIDPELPAARSLHDAAQRTWRHQPSTLPGGGGGATGLATTVPLPSPAELATIAAAADGLAPGAELVGWTIAYLAQIDLDGPDIDRLVALVWYTSICACMANVQTCAID